MFAKAIVRNPIVIECLIVRWFLFYIFIFLHNFAQPPETIFSLNENPCKVSIAFTDYDEWQTLPSVARFDKNLHETSRWSNEETQCNVGICTVVKNRNEYLVRQKKQEFFKN